MQRERATLDELEAQLTSLNADMYQRCGAMTAASLEALCRKINMTMYRMKSIKGGLRYGEK